jgi:hypothetical protein
MALDKFLIAPMSTGLETDVKPFLIPDDAFSQLNNAYIYRGRVKKRFGSSYLISGTSNPQLASRLRMIIAKTDGAGARTITAPGLKWKVGQMFSIGAEIFTVITLGVAQTMLRSVGAPACTYDTTNGQAVFTGADATTDIYFYPAEPVMGLITYQVENLNDESLFAFDTQFSYQLTATGWIRSGTDTWTGADYNFFWGASYRGAAADKSVLFVTNNKDKVRYWDPVAVAWVTPDWAYNGAEIIKSARICIPFHNRLLLMSVTETHTVAPAGDFEYTNRIRWSQEGNATSNTSFDDTVTGPGGGFMDATTKEAIVSVALIRDRLIVFFESSTYELVFTGNRADPFRLQQLNAELGVESTFSTVLFDRSVLGAGNVGIHSCNGAGVERIDEKIPQFVFQIANAEHGVERVYGIRDFYTEMVYWSIPVAENGVKYPNKVLCYNYKTGSWSLNDDSITCFGYFQNQTGITWSQLTMPWQQNSEPWNAGVHQDLYRNVIAGNQQGFTMLVEPDIGRNSPSLQVSNISTLASVVTITAVDHNLINGEYIAIETMVGTLIGIFPVDKVLTTATFNIVTDDPYFSVAYNGGTTIARVSRIDIKTKHYDFYMKQGLNVYVPTVEFYVDRTANGQIAVDVSTSSSNRSLTTDGYASHALLGSNIVETHPYRTLKVPADPINPYTYQVPYEVTQDRYWKRFYPQASGEVIQLRLFLNGSQMVTESIAFSPFELNAMVFYAQSVTR